MGASICADVSYISCVRMRVVDLTVHLRPWFFAWIVYVYDVYVFMQVCVCVFDCLHRCVCGCTCQQTLCLLQHHSRAQGPPLAAVLPHIPQALILVRFGVALCVFHATITIYEIVVYTRTHANGCICECVQT